MTNGPYKIDPDHAEYKQKEGHFSTQKRVKKSYVGCQETGVKGDPWSPILYIQVSSIHLLPFDLSNSSPRYCFRGTKMRVFDDSAPYFGFWSVALWSTHSYIHSYKASFSYENPYENSSKVTPKRVPFPSKWRYRAPFSINDPILLIFGMFMGSIIGFFWVFSHFTHTYIDSKSKTGNFA